MKKGFTLIELLIVVLIIGILAAVAVPQYQLSVEKSRANTALAVLKTIFQAQEAYYLEHGEYATSWDDLSIEKPKKQHFSYFLYFQSAAAYQADKNYYLFFRYTYRHGARIACGSQASEGPTDYAKKIFNLLGADLTKNEVNSSDPRWPISN